MKTKKEIEKCLYMRYLDWNVYQRVKLWRLMDNVEKEIENFRWVLDLDIMEYTIPTEKECKEFLGLK